MLSVGTNKPSDCGSVFSFRPIVNPREVTTPGAKGSESLIEMTKPQQPHTEAHKQSPCKAILTSEGVEQMEPDTVAQINVIYAS